LAARSRARPAANLARNAAIEFDGFGYAASDFFKIQVHVDTKVVPSTDTPTAIAKKVPKHPTAKNVAKGREDIFGGGESSAGAFDSGMTKAIVACSLFLIAQYLVGFGSFFEFDIGVHVALVAVRVKLHRQLAIRFGNLALVGALFDPQNFVIVSFGHASKSKKQAIVRTKRWPAKSSIENQTRTSTRSSGTQR
jgi:hypothetical protein